MQFTKMQGLKNPANKAEDESVEERDVVVVADKSKVVLVAIPMQIVSGVLCVLTHACWWPTIIYYSTNSHPCVAKQW